MILSSFWYHSGILGFLHVKFIADFRTMVMACSGHQFGLCRQFTYRTIILPTMAGHVLPSILHGRRTSTLSYPSPVSAPTSQMKLWSTCNLHNLVLSQLMIRRNMKLKRPPTPGSRGASYGTWLSSSGACTLIISGSPTLMSMPQQL